MSSAKTVVLITGGNQGIGFDTCTKFATSPDYHIFMASRSLEKGQTALADIKAKKLPGAISLVQLDVTDTASISTAVDSVSKEAGRVDVLVNNAGIISYNASSFQQDLRNTLETNTIGPALVTEAFLPLLKKSSAPRLIYVTSGLGSIHLRINPPNPAYDTANYQAYRMSKAALNMLAAGHHMLYKEWGLKVWTFCPGFVMTNLTGEEDRERRKQGGALSSETSAEGIWAMAEGKRDADVGKFVHKDGVYPW